MSATTLPPEHCHVSPRDHYLDNVDGATKVCKCYECGLWQHWAGPQLHGCRACMRKDFGTPTRPAWVVRVKVGTRLFGLLPRYVWTFKVRGRP